MAWTKGVFIKLGLALLLPMLGVLGCQNDTHTRKPNQPLTSTDQSRVIQTSPAELADTIRQLLAQGDYRAITPYIHPTQGVRFSMYGYVRETDKVFSRAEYNTYLTRSRIKFTWGDKDGTGEPLVITLPEYLSTWVVRDTSFDTVTVNDFALSGNSLNNLREFYDNPSFVEYSYQGSDIWQHMDWRVLRLVFETYQGRSYLVGIITDEWTI